MSVTKSSLTQNIVVHVPKKQIVELNSRLKKETHQLVVALRRITKVEETRKLEHHQLAEALRRITKLEEEVDFLNKVVHARMADDIEFRSEFDRMVKLTEDSRVT